MADAANNRLLVTATEEGHDFAYGVLDYSVGSMAPAGVEGAGYDWFTPTNNPGPDYAPYVMNPAVRVPLLGLAYHDVHMATWGQGDSSSKVPAYWDDKDPFTVLYGTMPTFVPPDQDYWNANLERFMASYHLPSSLNRSVGFDEMTNHTFVTADRLVQQTEFASGWTVTVNFGSSPYQHGGKRLAAKGFYATDGADREVFRLFDGTSTLAAAYTGDRIYLHPYGAAQTYRGITTAGSVFLRKDSATSVHLAFIGAQTSVTFDPAQMPFTVVGATAETTGATLPLTPVAGGKLRLDRPAGQRFVRLTIQ